jgi:hypothetical protein
MRSIPYGLLQLKKAFRDSLVNRPSANGITQFNFTEINSYYPKR